jgi:hypothetical protein
MISVSLNYSHCFIQVGQKEKQIRPGRMEAAGPEREIITANHATTFSEEEA